LDDPATRRACTRARRAARLAFVLWIALLPVSAVVMVLASLPEWSVVLPVIVVLPLVNYFGLRSSRAKRRQRILGVYPWERYTGVVQVGQNGVPFVRIPRPDAPEKSISVPVREHGARRWRRIVAADPKQEVWFAGDPRIGGVLALPGPRALALALQGGVAAGGPPLRGMGYEEIRRAKNAGFGDPKYVV